MSMVRTLLRDGYDGRAGRPVTFLHYARSPEDQIFADELARIAADDNDVTVHLRHGDAVFNELELRRLVPGYRDTDTWACGPAGMIELVRGGVRRQPAAAARALQAADAPPAARPRATSPSPATDRQVANTGASILEQAEEAGLTPVFGCRMGICFSCTTRKTEGTVRNVLTGTESSLPDEDIQICVSAPVGDCVVDL